MYVCIIIYKPNKLSKTYKPVYTYFTYKPAHVKIRCCFIRETFRTVLGVEKNSHEPILHFHTCCFISETSHEN